MDIQGVYKKIGIHKRNRFRERAKKQRVHLQRPNRPQLFQPPEL
jgi:hypothetical protein